MDASTSITFIKLYVRVCSHEILALFESCIQELNPFRKSYRFNKKNFRTTKIFDTTLRFMLDVMPIRP